MNSIKMKLNRQTGNTLMGIIIGLVIGLSIAVVVALVINKASTPFTNKGGKSDKPEDLPVTQMQDPNKPLYGAKEAVNQAAKEVAASKAAEGAKPAEVKADVKAEVKPEVKVADAAASKAEGGDDKYFYFLQIGAFKEQPDAESARAKLALVGVEASVSEKTSDTGTLYRVRVGPFEHADAMNKVRAKLSENSVDAAIVRTAK